MNNSSAEQPPSMVDAHFFISMIVINACSGVLATVLNFLIIMTFIKTPSLRTPSNVLILSLAITDFGVGLFVQPVYSIVIFGFMTSDVELLNNVSKVLRPASIILMWASILTLTAITVDRFFALHLHLRYKELVTTKRISMLVIMIWTFSVLWTCLRSFLSVGIGHIGNFLFLSLILIDTALMLIISRVVRHHAAEIQVQQQAMNAQPGAAVNIKRSVNIMYYILGTFFACYSLYIFLRIIHHFTPKWNLRTVLFVANTILLINSSINPIIYFWRIQGMRDAALRLLRSIRRDNNNNNNSFNNNNEIL